MYVPSTAARPITMLNLLGSAANLAVGLLGVSWLIARAVALPAGESQDITPSIVKFKSKLQPDVGLRFVQNSGVCETTPGVNQMSGYIDFGTNMSMVCSIIFPTIVLNSQRLP